MKRLLISTALILFYAPSAFAVSLQNKDSKSYDITVKSPSSTMRASIQGGTIKGNICSSCKITVGGVGNIEASGSDKVIIKNGKLNK